MNIIRSTLEAEEFRFPEEGLNQLKFLLLCTRGRSCRMLGSKNEEFSGLHFPEGFYATSHPHPEDLAAKDFRFQVAVRLNVTPSPRDAKAQWLLVLQGYSAVERYLMVRKWEPEGSKTRSRFLRAVTARRGWKRVVGGAEPL